MVDDTTSPDIALIRARAEADPTYVARLFQIESGGNPNAVTGSNRGLAQMGPAEEARYGITNANRADPAVQATATMREKAEHDAALRRALGRDPSPGESYLTHQQGIAGGPALLGADPSIPAWQAIRPFYKSDAMARLAITGNVPSDHPLYRQDADKITAGDFRNLWVKKFERGLGGAANSAAGGIPSAAPSAVPGPSMASVGPSQTGAVPVAPENAAGSNDELLRTLQTLSAPMAPHPIEASAPMQINFPMPKGLDRARALALAMGKSRIA